MIRKRKVEEALFLAVDSMRGAIDISVLGSDVLDNCISTQGACDKTFQIRKTFYAPLVMEAFYLLFVSVWFCIRRCEGGQSLSQDKWSISFRLLTAGLSLASVTLLCNGLFSSPNSDEQVYIGSLCAAASIFMSRAVQASFILISGEESEEALGVRQRSAN